MFVALANKDLLVNEVFWINIVFLADVDCGFANVTLSIFRPLCNTYNTENNSRLHGTVFIYLIGISHSTQGCLTCMCMMPPSSLR